MIPSEVKSPSTQTSVLSFPPARSMPSASSLGATAHLHMLLCLFLAYRTECGPLYFSYHFADEIRIFLFCALFI